MSNWAFHTTNDYLDFLNFHDCCVEDIQLVGDSIIVLFDSINVSSEHPLNPFEVAKTTGGCELTFNGVSHSDAVLYVDDDREQHVSETSLTELEVLKFGQRKIGTEYIFEVFGTRLENTSILWVEDTSTQFWAVLE